MTKARPFQPKSNPQNVDQFFQLEPLRSNTWFSGPWQDLWPRCFSLTAQGEYGDVHGVYGDRLVMVSNVEIYEDMNAWRDSNLLHFLNSEDAVDTKRI